MNSLKKIALLSLATLTFITSVQATELEPSKKITKTTLRIEAHKNILQSLNMIKLNANDLMAKEANQPNLLVKSNIGKLTAKVDTRVLTD